MAIKNQFTFPSKFGQFQRQQMEGDTQCAMNDASGSFIIIADIHKQYPPL